MLIPFKELFVRHKIKVSGVLHLGASIGQEAAAYSEQGIKQVVWVEAIPEIYAQLVRDTARFPGTQAFLACLSDVDGQEVTFHIANNGGQSSSLLEFGTHKKEHPTVRYVKDLKLTTTRTDTLLKERRVAVGPDWFLNIDLQGAELLALKGMGTLLAQFTHAYIEVNTKPLYCGCPLVHEIDDYLASFGMAGVETKMTNFGWGDKLYSRL